MLDLRQSSFIDWSSKYGHWPINTYESYQLPPTPRMRWGNHLLNLHVLQNPSILAPTPRPTGLDPDKTKNMNDLIYSDILFFGQQLWSA